MSKETPTIPWTWIFISGFALIFSLLMVYQAVYELFIWVEGVHVPRVRFRDEFYLSLSIPTVCWTIILICAGTCVALSARVLLNFRSGNPIPTSGIKWLIVFLWITQLAAYIVAFGDFMSSAGSFG